MLKANVRIAVTVALLAITASSSAEEVKRNLAACVSEELLDELTTYAAKKDYAGFRQLLMSGQCTLLPVGAKVSVISPGFMVATIRYKGQKLFTPSEAIR